MTPTRGGALTTAVAAIVITACGSAESGVCLTNDVGEVCANGGNGAIKFNGSGLMPGSEVLVDHPELGEAAYSVDAAGSFEPEGRGVLSLFAGTSFTFAVSATDSQGGTLDGELTVES